MKSYVASWATMTKKKYYEEIGEDAAEQLHRRVNTLGERLSFSVKSGGTSRFVLLADNGTVLSDGYRYPNEENPGLMQVNIHFEAHAPNPYKAAQLMMENFRTKGSKLFRMTTLGYNNITVNMRGCSFDKDGKVVIASIERQ